MVLPGKLAREARVQFANVIRRYMAGDGSLVPEIQANAKSNSPLAQMARDSLEGDTNDLKRRRLMEDAQLQSLQIQNRNASLGIVSTAMTLMNQVNPEWKKDGRLMLQLEDQIKNIAVPPSLSGYTTNGSLNHTPITISEVAKQLGYNMNQSQLIQAGRAVAKAYRKKHNSEPSEHAQYVEGATRMIKSYTEVDRDIVEEAVKQIMGV
jgi:hypothetical protein